MNNKKLPLVSVIITTYKRADMLERAIDSVLAQTYKEIEIIVVDDNNPNTDYRIATEKTLEKYKNLYNFTYVKHSKNLNGAAARNTGINKSNGSLVTFLDDDDIYYTKKIEQQVYYLIEHQEFDAVYCGWDRADKKVIPTKIGDLTFEILSGINLVYTNTIMIKKNVALSFQGWDERFKRNQEAAFLLRFFKNGHKIGVVSEVLVEFDISDRENASIAKKNEEDFTFFLNAHKNQIESCSNKKNNAKKIIYSYRYRGVLLAYLKSKKYNSAFKLYIKTIKVIPIRFNLDIIKYVLAKLSGKDVFKEYGV